MIAGCPKCSARYRVDLEQIGQNGAKLRCTKCSAVFLVRAPQSAARPATTPAPVQPPQQQPAATPEPVHTSTPAPAQAPAPTARPAPVVDSAVLVLIADPDEERGKQNAAAIEDWGLTPVLVHDGVEAMLAIQRMQPKLVVLDAALPKMFGFQVCEVVKRNESLRSIRVVLVGAIHHQDRYRRDPSDLYGADVYLEQPDLPEGLLPLLREAGLPVSEAASPPTQAPASRPAPAASIPDPAPDPRGAASSFEEPLSFETPPPRAPDIEETVIAPVATPAATAPAQAPSNENPEIAAERERAERLARIAVSEMLLYQPEKFDKAIRDGNVESMLDLEIQEARALIRQRISEEVRAEKDFILVELERVTKQRGAAS